jgi:ferritin-like metal-binding protein YciE
MEGNTLNSALQSFFVTSLQELYWAEKNLVNVLQTMTEAATTSQLKKAFDLHRQQTVHHAQNLEQVFTEMGLEPQPEPSVGLQGLFDEGWQVIDETEEGSAQRDVALIIAAQKVEHYEIACYGSLVTLANTLGLSNITKLLAPVLQEEKDTDMTLTAIAEGGINAQASEESILQAS